MQAPLVPQAAIRTHAPNARRDTKTTQLPRSLSRISPFISNCLFPMSNLFDSSSFRGTLLPALYLLAIGLAGCSQPATTNATTPAQPDMKKAARAPAVASSTDTPQDDDLATFAKGLGAHCDDAPKGHGCVLGNMDAGDFYDIELSPDCGPEGFFAGVSERDAPLLDTLPVTGSKAKINARLSDGQFVCVQATARVGQQANYYYVVSIPTSSVAACQGKPICNQYGDRPIIFVAQQNSGKACALTSSGRPRGDCARGWVEPQKLDVFSNGI